MNGAKAEQGLIASYIANEPFHGQTTSKLDWNSRVCGWITIIGYIGINNYRLLILLTLLSTVNIAETSFRLCSETIPAANSPYLH